MLAGVVAKGFVSPLSNVTVRQQTATAKKRDVDGGKEGEEGRVEMKGDADSSDSDDDAGYDHAPTIIDVGRDIVDEKGWTGLWSGFKSSIILVSLARHREQKV